MTSPSGSESLAFDTSSTDRQPPSSTDQAREQTREQVRERAQLALLNSPVFDLRRLCVERIGDSLLISGRVHSFYHKQLAQESIRSVAGQHNVVNQVNVTERPRAK